MRERTTYREVDRDFPHSVSLTEDQKFLDGSTLFLDGLCQINTTKTKKNLMTNHFFILNKDVKNLKIGPFGPIF